MLESATLSRYLFVLCDERLLDPTHDADARTKAERSASFCPIRYEQENPLGLSI